MSLVACWGAVFVVAFSAFAVISALIAVKGLAEVRELFHHLEQGEAEDDVGPEAADSGKNER